MCGTSDTHASSWHGTQVAGIVAAQANNGLGIAGVGGATRVLPVRVLGKCGGFDSDIIAGMRWAAGLTVPGVPANPNPVLKEFFDYYRMPRGFHPRSVNSTGAWNATMPLSFMNMPLLSYASEVTIPTLIVTGEKAHSRYFAEDAFKAIGSSEKALVIVPGANHVDLYDNVAGKIPFATFTQFFKTNLQ